MLVVASGATLIAIAATGCGGSGNGSASGPEPGSTPPSDLGSQLHGVPATPSFPAPALRLRNYNGTAVDLSSFKGKAVLVTFLYTHCPDVCPIITGNLHAAQSELGSAAQDLQIIAVSVDPKGDTPATVAKFLHEHQMTGRMDWLIGSRTQLQRTWKTWGIGANIPKNHPNVVEHSAETFGIDASGTVQTFYPGNFKPAWLVQDVPLLAQG